VYDISKYNTFQNIERWFAELREHAEYNICVLLVGNKSDLKQNRAVQTEEASNYAKKHGKSILI
jgi:GTPase SAR1 family protein